MARLVLAIIALVMAIAALKLLIAALVVAGLIFRTKQTVGLLLLTGVFGLLATYPIAGLAVLAIAAISAIVRIARREGSPTLLQEQRMDDPDRE